MSARVTTSSAGNNFISKWYIQIQKKKKVYSLFFLHTQFLIHGSQMYRLMYKTAGAKSPQFTHLGFISFNGMGSDRNTVS